MEVGDVISWVKPSRVEKFERSIPVSQECGFATDYWSFFEIWITLEGRVQGEKGCGRPRTMFLDWLLKTENDNISYDEDELKMLAQDRSRWYQWRWKPAIWAEYYSSRWNIVHSGTIWAALTLNIWDNSSTFWIIWSYGVRPLTTHASAPVQCVEIRRWQFTNFKTYFSKQP